MDKLYQKYNKDILESTIDFKPLGTIDNDQTKIANDILKANETGLINSLINSNLALIPKLIVNDYTKGSKVLSDIVSELKKCNEFMLSVAFITSSGVIPLLETLKDLEKKGVQGKILTTDYLNFSEPKALKKLLEFSNIEIKMYCKDNFHTKGYIFKHIDHYKIIVGSSNLTQTALTKNNEGVDIPRVNQVVMLRPTKSAIIFIQQLGRGLRTFNDKEYVVIIDFVGNYNSNFLIPIALSGDRTFNKDTIRKYVMEGNRIIPGCSTVNFDEISRKRIFESIDKANFNDIKIIKESYNSLKQKLGRIPFLKDFDLYNAIDPIRIFDNSSLGSYHKFLTKYEKDYNIKLNSLQESFIEFISKKLASGKRVHELEMIKCAINYNTNLIPRLKQILKQKYNIDFKNSTTTSIVNVLTNQFPSGTGKETYKECIFLEQYGADYKISEVFIENLENQEFKKIVLELIDFGIDRYKQFYSDAYMKTSFQLYQKYTYEDVCRLLEWLKNEVATNIGGYKFNKETKTYPVFINYNKSEDISDSIKYEDRFESSNQLIAISKQPRKVTSPDVIQIYNAEKDNVEMSLFVRKHKDDKTSKEFYYLGKIKATGSPNPIVMKNTNKPAVEIKYQLSTPVREDIFDYIIS